MPLGEFSFWKSFVIDNQPDFFSLNRLILLDSYRQGRKAEVRLDGHTSFNGENAAGKTSLLRLIPLFYGESPNKLVHGGGVTQSFIGHYLPHSTSFIIFEYNRRGVDCMVVLHASKSGENVCYRFIDQPFDIARFVDEAGEPVIGADLNRHIEKRGEFCSPQITALTDYRKIIQNTGPKKEYRPLAARFAFVGAGSRLGHIEKIATGMFSRVTNFHDLKRIIVSCIMDEGQSVRLESNKAAMDSWLKEYRAYQAVMAHSGRMKALGEASLRYGAAASQLRGVHTEFLLLKRQHEATILAATDRIDELEREMGQLDEETRRQLEELWRKMSGVKGNIEDLQRRISALESRRDQYANDKIEELARLVSDLPQLAARVDELKARQEALLGKSGGLATRFGNLKNERTARFHAYEREQNARKEPIRAQLETERDRLEEKSKAEWSAIEARFGEREKALQDDRTAISEELGGLRVKAASPQPDQKYVDARDNAQVDLNKATEVHLKASKAYDESEQAHSQEVLEFNAIDDRIQTLHEQQRINKVRHAHLLTLSSAPPGTLLHFLREHRPDWGADIARVVPEELLLRDDLDPSLTEESELALYGVLLDLSVIDAPLASSEEALQEEIEASNRAIERLHGDIKTAEKELEAQSDRMNGAKEETERRNILRIQAESHEKACKTALHAAQRALVEDQRQAGLNATRELKGKEDELRKTNTALTTLKEALAEQKNSHESALRTAQKAAADKASKAIADIDDAIRQEKTACDRDIEALDAELAVALQAEGVDVTSLETLKKEILSADAMLKKARDGSGRVDGWQNWLKDEWSRIEPLRRDLSREKDEATRLAGEEVKINQARESKGGVLKGQFDAEKGRMKAAEQFLGFVNKRCERLAEWPADRIEVESRPTPSKSQDALEAEMDRALNEISVERDKARKEVEPIRRSMFEHPDTTPYDFYEKSRKALGPDQESGSPFLWVKPLQEWFETANVDSRRLLLSQCRTFSQDIHEFHDRLDKFKRQVSVFSKDLQDKMSKAILFRSINGVSARLTTSLDSLEGWDRIKKLDDEYTAWAGMDSNELPSDSFAMAVGDVHRFLQGRHVEVRLEDLIGIEIDIEESGQPKKTVKDEMQLKDVSSNGLSYLILCVVFVGLINQIRRNEPVKLVWALDELRDLDIGNVQALLEMLTQNHIHLVSAFPDPDPDVLSLFKNRYTIQAGRKIVTFGIPEETSHV